VPQPARHRDTSEKVGAMAIKIGIRSVALLLAYVCVRGAYAFFQQRTSHTLQHVVPHAG
jgi:hypothetical protein